MAVLSCNLQNNTDWSATLERYRQGPPFFIATPSRTLLATRFGMPIEGCAAQPNDVLRQVHAALESRPAQGPRVVVGALPFDSSRAVQLFCPSEVEESGPYLSSAPRGAPISGCFPRLDLDSPHQDARFLSGVTRALQLIEAGRLEKVVLAQAIDLDLEHGPHVGHLLQCLRAQHPQGHIFAQRCQESSLVGASPELLIARWGSEVRSTPLAGSRPRPRSEQQERAIIEELLCSDKDQREHRLVVEEIVSRLRPLTQVLEYSKRPLIFKTPTMLHLGTPIVGKLSDPSVTSLALALALHPTPAVCGLPPREAARFIAEVEGTERGLFGGAVGYMDAHGDGEWAVTIRCAQVGPRGARLFAGAGVVRASEPAQELQEIKSKMTTMLRALGDVS